MLEILRMKHEKELKRKQIAQQDLEEFNEWWDKHEKEQLLATIGVIVFVFVCFGVAWLMSKIG